MAQLQTIVHTIEDIRFSDASRIEQGVLHVERGRIESLAEGVRLKSVELAKPGESVRIAPVLDVVEPRAKDDPARAAFPGWSQGSSDAGAGRTHVLSGVAVVAVAKIPGVQEGLMDMQRTAQPFSPFARTLNLVLVFEPPPAMDPSAADAAIRQSTLRVAEYLGSLARGLPADRTESYEWPPAENNLPKAVLVYLVQSQGKLRRTYLRGRPLDDAMPQAISPLEVLDGALVSGNFVMPCNKTCTYIHQNHPLIHEMFKLTGRSLDFCGVILANEMSRLEDKKRAASEVLRLAGEMKAQGAIINQEGGANTLTDVMMLCRGLEQSGVRTVLLLNEFAGAQGATPSLAETTPEAAHIVSTGNNDYSLALEKVEKFIGFGPFPGAGDALTAPVAVPLTRVHSSTNPLGFNRLTCRTDAPPLRPKYSKLARPLRVVHYLNQFFGQIGGEDHAHVDVQVKEGPVGPGLALKAQLGEAGEVVATIICGDNAMAENLEAKSAAAAELAERFGADLLIAGPCFVAGRYGMACGAVAKAVGERLGIPAVIGIAEQNPAVEVYRRHAFMVPVGSSAAKTRQAIQAMVEVALALREGRWPEPGKMLPRGIRELATAEQNGAARAAEMLAALVAGRTVETELPLPKFDRVDWAPPLEDLSQATLVLATEGGLTPQGNPDKIEMSMATKFGCYELAGVETLDPARFTVAHGGFDNSAARQDPNRILPLDAVRELEKEKVIGRVAEVFYTTAGNATSVENAARFGRSIAEDIRKRFAQKVGVLFTST